MSEAAVPPSDQTEAAEVEVPFGEAVWTWSRVAALSFGGPAGQIAVMHRIIVDEKRWVRDEQFLHALNFCTLLPGPEAQQLATYIGWLLHGTRGGLIAGTLFILPGCLAILALSLLYAAYIETTWLQALLFGLKPAVVAIVMEAVVRIGKRVLKTTAARVMAVLSFLAIFVGDVPFPAIILGAGVVGALGSRWFPAQFPALKGHAASGAADDDWPRWKLHPIPTPTLWRTIRVCALFLSLWFVPLGLIALTLGSDSVLYQEGIFFSKTAVVTFGGAYAVLAYVAQEAVDRYQWMQPGEMLDGLGMAETTPGPLIMVVQFVGFLGAYRNPGPFDPWVAAILGSMITTWVTFVPCFFWIFLGAPYVEKLRGVRWLSSALSTITAAVVGVISNLGVWFALHTWFGEVSTPVWHGLRMLVPNWSTLHPGSLALTLLACTLTFAWRWSMLTTLLVTMLVGICGALLLG